MQAAVPCNCNAVARIPATLCFLARAHTNERGPLRTRTDCRAGRFVVPLSPCVPSRLHGDKVEAMAQLGGLICLQEPCSDGKGTFFFAGVDGVRPVCFFCFCLMWMPTFCGFTTHRSLFATTAVTVTYQCVHLGCAAMMQCDSSCSSWRRRRG